MAISGGQLKSFMNVGEQHFAHVHRGALSDERWSQSNRTRLGKTIRDSMFLQVAMVALAMLPAQAKSQALSFSGDPSDNAGSTTTEQLDVTYVRPTQRTMVSNYAFDTFGPYPIVGAAFAAGVNQFTNSPPEWNQGVEGYSKRFGSDFGIAAVTTTTRYSLAQAFREDTLYYRCECSGFFPRLRHAAISTLTGRHGEDGHRVFSIPALVAPYAGTMTAVYGWYPNRYGPKDAFRMGNYTMLSYMGSNVSLEFLFSGPHSFLSRMHLNNTHGSPEPGPNH
jgi:hypothetical protein